MKDSITSISVSFSGTVLLFSLFEILNLTPPINTKFILVLFLMTVTMGAFNEALNTFEKKVKELPIILDFFLRLVFCYASVFLEGSLVDMIPFEWISFLYISPVIIPVYTSTYLLMYSYAKKSADSINKKLEQNKHL